jgi:hypothetical protein
MRTRSWAKSLPLLLMLLSVAVHGEDSAEPYRFFRQYAGLTEDQIEAIKDGQAFAKIMNSVTADEVIVFGAVYVKATPESYLRFACDIEHLRRLPGYLAIRKFSDPPQLSDLDGFTLEPDDVRQLQNCRPGKCEVQLPAESMEEFQRSVNWSAPDVAEQVNRLAQKMALQALLGYMQGGNTALGVYRDKNHPTEVAATFKSLLSRSQALPTYLPEFDRYLLDYPDLKLPNVQTQFYWEKVNFGLKPTLRIVQAIIYRGSKPAEPAYVVAVKQLYSSHYFETALDLTVCATDQERPNQRGFYLITLKGSQQAGLTGLKGSIVRKVAVDKTRSSLERALAAIKQNLEAESE